MLLERRDPLELSMYNQILVLSYNNHIHFFWVGSTIGYACNVRNSCVVKNRRGWRVEMLEFKRLRGVHEFWNKC